MRSIFQLLKALICIGIVAVAIYLAYNRDEAQELGESLEGVIEQIDEALPKSYPVYGDREPYVDSAGNLPEPKILPVPANGQSHVTYTGSAKWTVAVINKSKDLHSLVKIVDNRTGRLMSKHFIRAGGRIDIKVPDGTFHVRIASGKDWYGEPYLFGPETELYAMKEAYNYGGSKQVRYVDRLEINIPNLLSEDHSEEIRNEHW